MAERALQHGKSLAVLGLRVSEELYRLLRAQSYARRGYVVILDRHPYADYFARRVRATDAWIRWGDRIHGLLLQWVYPRPQGLVLLDAPAEILHARKPEGSLAAVRARRQAACSQSSTCLDPRRRSWPISSGSREAPGRSNDRAARNVHLD
jgi:hypothetical protein